MCLLVMRSQSQLAADRFPHHTAGLMNVVVLLSVGQTMQLHCFDVSEVTHIQVRNRCQTEQYEIDDNILYFYRVCFFHSFIRPGRLPEKLTDVQMFIQS